MRTRKRIWKPEIEGKEHVIELTHGYWSGKREIRVDGNLVHRGYRPIDWGSQHQFELGRYDCTLRITYGFGFRYGLRVDNRIVIPSQEHTDCDRVDWVFVPKTLGDYLAQISCRLGGIFCAILAVHVLLCLAGGPILGLMSVHFGWIYVLPAPICVAAGSLALVLPGSHQKAKRARAFKGIAFGAIMFIWLAFFWAYIVPAMSQAL